MISSVAPTQSSTFYAYLITKIGNRNLKPDLRRKKWCLASNVGQFRQVFKHLLQQIRLA